MTLEKHLIQSRATFPQALSAVMQGNMASRKGWNGKGMFIWLMKGQWLPAKDTSGILGAIADMNEDKRVLILPALAMKTAQGQVLIGWLASQSDMIAEDWEVYSNHEVSYPDNYPQ